MPVLSELDAAGAGAVGAAVWLVLVYGLPLALQAARGEFAWTPVAQSLVGITFAVVFYLLLGAVASVLAQATSVREALAYGLGWQGVVGQFVRPSAR